MLTGIFPDTEHPVCAILKKRITTVDIFFIRDFFVRFFLMKLFDIIKRSDIILLLFILLTAFLVFIPYKSGLYAADASPAEVVVTQNGKEYLRCSLFEDRIIDMGSNIISVENGSVHMKSADCKNQVCVNTGEINKTGQSIICLPNRITVRITGEEGPDAVTR